MDHSDFQAYGDQVFEVLNKFRTTQQATMELAAKAIVKAYLDKKRFLIFGSGHSHMIAEEFYARAGGLAFVTMMIQNELTLTDHPMKSTHFERVEGLGQAYFELYHLEAGDVLLIASNSGRNPLPVELARLAHEAGVTVIAFTNASQVKQVTSRHSSGKNLDAYANLILDNCGAYGDAGYELPNGQRMGSTSTVVGAFMAQALSIMIAQDLLDRGLELPVFRSSNLDGADEDNKRLFERFCRMY